MVRLAIIVICVLQLANAVNEAGYYSYTVIGPGTIHSEGKYHVAVTAHHNISPSKIKVGIEGTSYNETKAVELQSGQTTLMEFDVPYLEKGTYKLISESISGVPFKNSTVLNMEIFKPYIWIQTDKSRYKPGDVVNFRVLFLDENLKPDQPDNSTAIWFKDPNYKIISEIQNFEVVKGVCTGKLQLSKFAVLGSWNLHAHQGGDKSDGSGISVRFEVDEYVLPLYEVVVEAPKGVSVKDGDMQVVVRANYTNGKPVNGKVTTLLEVSGFDSRQLEPPPVHIKTADMVNGKAKFEFNIKEWDTHVTERRYSYGVTATATVEENFTGVKINGTSRTRCYAYRYDMYYIGPECRHFSAGEEYDAAVSVKYIEGTPLTDFKSVVKLVYEEKLQKTYRNIQSPLNQNRTFVFKSYLNASGIAAFKVKLPYLEDFAELPGYYHYFQKHVEFMDEYGILYGECRQERKGFASPTPAVPATTPKDLKWFKVEAKYMEKEYSYKMGDEATIELNSSLPVSYFVYNIIARGNIQRSARVDLPGKSKIHQFKFPTTFAMEPRASVYAYYVDEAGDFHYAETFLFVIFEFQNPIEITAEKQVKPGEDVALRIKTAPNSFVGLLAVDQSVLLLATNNDLKPTEFGPKLHDFKTETPWQGGYSYYPGEKSGVVTQTNANYFYNRTKPNQHYLPPRPAHHFIVRKNFPETWIFDNIENTESAEFTWTKKIPDTITSWIVTGFSLHPLKGLGVTKDKTKITSSQPFFIAIRLPYSVKKGEVIRIPALIFNYLDKILDVFVTLDNSDDEYEFLEVSNEIINERKRVKSVRVPSQEAAEVSFIIRPKIVGNVMLKFTAVSPLAGDAIYKTLRVEPEGVTQYANRAYFVNLKTKPSFKETFELELPAELVPDSERIEFSVVGDLLGPMIQNLDRLLRLPMSFGEPTMSAMVTNYLALRYLKRTNRLAPALETKLKENLVSSYQNILNYRHSDGSFSFFGPATAKEQPRNSSVWLTSYVIRSLNLMKDLKKLPHSIFAAGLNFLAANQAENGAFVETGGYTNQKSDVSLTASVLLAFVEIIPKEWLEISGFKDTVDRGYNYLLQNFEKDGRLQSKALTVYALHMAKHEMAPQYAASLKSLAKKEGDRMWWSKMAEASSEDVEVTSCMLLTMLEMDAVSLDEVLPIVNWLVAQRNSNGGFHSTQDTVVGLQALMKFAEKSGYNPVAIEIEYDVKSGSEEHNVVRVNHDNGLVVQIFELPVNTRKVEFEAKGKGTSLVQVSYQYNLLEQETKSSFLIYTVINYEAPKFKLEMDVCVEYVGDTEFTNMALLEISLPSGYIANNKSFGQIRTLILFDPFVRLIETKNADSVIVIYFDHLRKGETRCLPIEAIKWFDVVMQKPASIVLYDYYDTSRRATAHYEVLSYMCDLCVGEEECLNACEQ